MEIREIVMFDANVGYLAAIHCLNGTIGALVAKNKGYSPFKWLLYGLIGGTVTLIAAIYLPKTS